MKQKLGLQISLFTKAVALQIFEQEGLGRHRDIYTSESENFSLKCSSQPELGNRVLYLRGDSAHNLDITRYTYITEGEKPKHLAKVLATLEEWADSINATFTKKDLGHTIIIHVVEK